ncbi:hypothetical protein AMECASPLE_017031 [Ameca splendens]|uniref:Uncharacterized protein n=1 Tax=Ameca splendens TaxID=208324 RepID=A0ABV0Y2B6_9TELE
MLDYTPCCMVAVSSPALDNPPWFWTSLDPSDQVQNRSPLHSLSLSTLQHRTPAGGFHSHSVLATQPLSLAHLSPDSPPSPTMSRFRKPAGYGVLTLPRKHPFQ